MDEVRSLFIAINLHVFLDAVSTMRIDGQTLFLCKSMENLKELGLDNNIKASVLLRELPTYRAEGVPSSMLDPSGNV